MRFFFQAPIVAILFCLPATAQENPSLAMQETAQEKMEIGRGVICDTLEQVRRYVELRGNGAETSIALQVVNENARVPVCSVAMVMFSAGARVSGLAVQGRLLSIIQINIHAVGQGPVWMKVPATVRYTVTAEKGQVV
jgi:hypothetical protein